MCDKNCDKKKAPLDGCCPDERKKIDEYVNQYATFLNTYKNEVERVQWATKEFGGKKLELGGDETLNTGDRFYYTHRDRIAIYGVVGEDKSAYTIIGAHVDIPHIHLKPTFLKNADEQGCCVLETHYYGGIKKYVYQTTPLLMKIVHADGKGRHIYSIGDKPGDPVFTMPDLLAHLQAHQAERKMADVIKAEEQQVLGCSTKGEHATFTDNFLAILKERTGLTKEDLPYCEFQLFGAQECRRVGIDSAVLGAPGQDDGVCTYTALKALTEIEKPKYTSICLLASREETGSDAFTGAQSNFMLFVLKDVCRRMGIPDYKFTAMSSNSRVISADVSAVKDFNFPGAYDKLNTAVINNGPCVCRYVGARGKVGTSEAYAEFMYEFREAFKGIPYQMAMFGKVDLGGGGTIGKYCSQQLNCDVIDIGPGVMNMHTWFELVGIADIYYAHQLYKAFYNRK